MYNLGALVQGTVTVGHSVTLYIYDAGISGGFTTATFTVPGGTGNNLPLVTSGLNTQFGFNTLASRSGITPGPGGVTTVGLSSNSVNKTAFGGAGTNLANSISLLINNPQNGQATVALSDTSFTINDILTISVYDDALLPGTAFDFNYTVTASDTTLPLLATHMATAFNATAFLNQYFFARAAGSVLSIRSYSGALSTYTVSKSTGATESMALSYTTGGKGYSYNNVNALTSTAAGGPVRIVGSSSKAIVSATTQVGAGAQVPAYLNWSQNFTANPVLSSGLNTVTVRGTDAQASPQTATSTFQISIPSSGGSSVVTDANGNMTNDGTNSYSWDTEDRLIQITYGNPVNGNNSQFVYDPMDRCVKIVETVSGSVTSTKQFVWCGSSRCEERDGTGALVSQFFPLGQKTSGTSYYYTKDIIPGSIREMTDGSGAIQAQYAYDPYGRATKLQGSLAADFQYAGYYQHPRSGFSLTRTRQYSPVLGRWISRDPIGENGGTNLYGYADNNPISFTDPLGLKLIVNGDTENNWQQTKDYLSNDPGMKKLIKDLDNLPDQIAININGTQYTQAQTDGKSVDWDPHAALHFRNPDGKCGFRSPALGLGHELAHIWQIKTSSPMALQMLYQPTYDEYDRYIEKQTILNYENPAAKNLGEDQRFTHQGGNGSFPDFNYVSSPLHR